MAECTLRAPLPGQGESNCSLCCFHQMFNAELWLKTISSTSSPASL